MKKRKNLIDKALRRLLPNAGAYPPVIHKAMHYALFPGGKRIRPVLCLLAYEAVKKGAVPFKAACAIELVHNYSLVHDDLPCMDNDDYRRGKPTVHKKFGETIAVLTGDALLTLAFKVIAEINDSKISRKVASILAKAIGTQGMIAGQVVDLNLSKTARTAMAANQEARIKYINSHKTGALIGAALEIGGVTTKASPVKIKILKQAGKKIGLLFQITDDILDNQGYVKLYGKTGARKKAEKTATEAKRTLAKLGRRARALIAMCDAVLNRKS